MLGVVELYEQCCTSIACHGIKNAWVYIRFPCVEWPFDTKALACGDFSAPVPIGDVVFNDGNVITVRFRAVETVRWMHNTGIIAIMEKT
jgi:hypothetical protein